MYEACEQTRQDGDPRMAEEEERPAARAKSVGPLIFGTHTTEDINVITDVWRRKLKVLWEMVGPWKVKPEHHRLWRRSNTTSTQG
jgi:hypothetical protein